MLPTMILQQTEKNMCKLKINNEYKRKDKKQSNEIAIESPKTPMMNKLKLRNIQ